jgi:hypothetical protein
MFYQTSETMLDIFKLILRYFKSFYGENYVLAKKRSRTEKWGLKFHKTGGQENLPSYWSKGSVTAMGKDVLLWNDDSFIGL